MPNELLPKQQNGNGCENTSFFPSKQGLYDPQFEHDACGAGFICSLNGEKSHDVVQRALEILVKLTHRGATGHDGGTGDGAGILIQIPDAFLRDVCEPLSITLPTEGNYATGLIFFPRSSTERACCIQKFERVIEEEGQEFLGWRRVPVNASVLGKTAQDKMPSIMQVFIGKGRNIRTNRDFERKLFVIRKVMERQIRESQLKEKQYFYIPSLSSRTMVYKGLLLADQIETFYEDLQNEHLVSALALVHQRYSTNTFPSWPLAQPFRYLCHNGEINTLRGNVNWLHTRESLFKNDDFGADMQKIFPIATTGGSDSAVLDNALELLYHTGRSLPHAMLMLIPEAWEHHQSMSPEEKAFYEYHACLMEPWDGPAFVPFTDGEIIGAVLDRNGLRPARYTITKKGYVIMASETGVLDIPPDRVAAKGRLEPGKMFLVDMKKGRVVENAEIMRELAARQPYGEWLKNNQVDFADLADPQKYYRGNPETLVQRQRLFGYSQEDLKLLLSPMAKDGKEPIGSMGDDTPLAVLSQKPRLLYDYFKQLFAQVTNPPLDAMREELVTSLGLSIGKDSDIFHETPQHCRLFKLDQPILTNKQLAQIRSMVGDIRSETLDIIYPVVEGAAGLENALQRLCARAAELVRDGAAIIVLSDQKADKANAPIPAALATSAVHHFLIREKLRTRCGLVIESAEPREVHHFCLLVGYGASAINPYLAFETIENLQERGILSSLDAKTAIRRYIDAIGKGILKVMSKMGISTLQSYQGAQIFEAIGLSDAVVDKYFCGTPSRIGGIGLDGIHREVQLRFQLAFPEREISENPDLTVGGKYQWRRDGESHHFNPLSIARLQQAARQRDPKSYKEFANLVNQRNKDAGTLRGLLDFRINDRERIPLHMVEDWTEIVKRFKTGAMSYGSISKEAHESLAIAMNRIGGRSNSGEGGEDADRFLPDDNGNLRRSAIKQVASGRFGVTSHYLVNCEEIQIKMAQGAKPGEGGQLPAFKVYPWIAKTRHSTPWVGLISPPPHHDIYSIEDLAQLIFDLKNANSRARINVKLVSEVGVGTVAAGVAKGKADVVLISGHDGGTGASPLTSLKHTGLPWELGLAEAHQTLVLNDLRSRITVEVDGQFKTGRDVAIAALLGAEEFGFATAPLIAMGCVMMRVCHLNTCPVGIATQDPELRQKFNGQPEHVINYFYLVAQELREIMAQLGYRTLNEMIGHTERLQMDPAVGHWKAGGIDLSKLLHKPHRQHRGSTLFCSQQQDHELDEQLDHSLIEKAKPALESGKKVQIETNIWNVNRSVGTMLSSEISRKYGENGLPEDTISITCNGAAGQSFGAFGAKGITFRINGDANDYFGKGLSGAKLVITPDKAATFKPEENIILGNVALYGATSGEAYIRGIAGERFAVRNSGANAVVEGIGDHGCEYMTGGRVVVLGKTGRNFAAGMSGGIAYVLDDSHSFRDYLCNTEMVDLELLENIGDVAELKRLIENHLLFTDSSLARCILNYWDEFLPKFVKVMPRDYKQALERIAEERQTNRNTAAGIIKRGA